MTSSTVASSSIRRAVAGAALLLGVLGALSAGCGGTTKCEDTDCGTGGTGGGASTGGTGGAASCTATKGTISGTVYYGSGPGMSNGQVAANAVLEFVVSPGGPNATILQGKADDMGNFSVELDPETWLVGGDDGTGCINSMPLTVTLDACETETIEVVLDICSG